MSLPIEEKLTATEFPSARQSHTEVRVFLVRDILVSAGIHGDRERRDFILMFAWPKVIQFRNAQVGTTAYG